MQIFRQVTANNVILNEYPFKRELSMESYLMENEEILKLDDGNFSEVNVLDAEVALKNESDNSNNNKRIDILAKYGIDYLAIAELKLDELDKNALNQLIGYLQERDKILYNQEIYWDENDSKPNWIGILVGNSISSELKKLLEENDYTIDNFPIAVLVVNRYKSSRNEIFVTTDTYFKFKYSNKDYSKFYFRGKKYNKARLVNKVVRTYVENNPKIEMANLREIFPDYLQNGYGVFVTKEQAIKKFEETGYKRYYINPDELIKIHDTTIATCNQWGVGNIRTFKEHVNSQLGEDYKIKQAEY